MGSEDLIEVPTDVLEPNRSLGCFAKTNLLMAASVKMTDKNSIQPIFESRGVAMIRAALKDKNKNNINKSINGQQGTYNKVQDLNYEFISHKQTNESLKVRKRSSKNNVLFTEPVVTDLFEYEPTHLEIAPNNDSPPSQKNIFEHRYRKKLVVLPSSCGSGFYRPGSPKVQHRAQSLGSLDRTDSEDDLIAFESSEKDIKKLERISTPKSVKRNYEATCDRASDNVQLKSSNSSLFSPPKVAKIMPYYDESAIKIDNVEENAPNGYFSWLTNFISGRMSKLIF